MHPFIAFPFLSSLDYGHRSLEGFWYSHHDHGIETTRVLFPTLLCFVIVLVIFFVGCSALSRTLPALPPSPPSLTQTILICLVVLSTICYVRKCPLRSQTAGGSALYRVANRGTRGAGGFGGEVKKGRWRTLQPSLCVFNALVVS